MHKLHGIPTKQDIEIAHKAILPYIHRTPVLTSKSINQLTGADIYFKCENFQKIGAFKMRGAICTALSLTVEELNKGLTTHSSGNHAQAVALSAKTLGVPAHIIMPENSPKIKLQATKGYGATIYLSGNTIEDRTTKCNEVRESTGATFIHPFDNYNVIAGQATASKELLEEESDLDIIISPIGGGGLMSGTAIYTKSTNENISVYGVEPKIVDDAYRSIKEGSIQKNATINTIADGLRTNLSEKTFEIIRTHVDQIFTVSEDEIIHAMRVIWERMKIIIEPSCAVPLAAIIGNKAHFEGKKIGVILTGGNVDLSTLPF